MLPRDQLHEAHLAHRRLAGRVPRARRGGLLGTILTGVFASQALGIFSGQEDISIGSQLGVQAIGGFAVLGYTALVTFIILKVVDVVVGNRVTEEQETEGLDLVMHNERGYDL